MASVSAAPSGNLGRGPSSQPHESSSLQTSSSKSDYIRTATQTYISRKANILGAPYLITKGKSVIQAGATVHGDYGAPIHIGRYCRVETGVVMMPSIVPNSNDPLLAIARPTGDHAPPGKNEKALPIIIGSHTQIGAHTRIQSISIGSSVRIGSNCVLMPRSKVHDCCIIEDGTLVPTDMVVPPFSRVSGSPGKIVGSLPECTGGELVEGRVHDYLQFVRQLED